MAAKVPPADATVQKVIEPQQPQHAQDPSSVAPRDCRMGIGPSRPRRGRRP